MSKTAKSFRRQILNKELELLELDLERSFENFLHTDGKTVTNASTKYAAEYMMTRFNNLLKVVEKAIEIEARVDQMTEDMALTKSSIKINRDELLSLKGRYV